MQPAAAACAGLPRQGAAPEAPGAVRGTYVLLVACGAISVCVWSYDAAIHEKDAEFDVDRLDLVLGSIYNPSIMAGPQTMALKGWPSHHHAVCC